MAEENQTSVPHMPEGRWAFDEGVTDVFEDMLRRSIPQYDEMRKVVLSVGSRYVQRNTDIVDIGCSRGDALAGFVKRFGAYNRFVGIEVSEPMAKVFRERFAPYAMSGIVSLDQRDLRTSYPPVQSSLTLSILTLQFIPIEHRQRLVSDIYESTKPGGAVIVVEKILGASSTLNAMMVDLYYDMKRANGYTQESIDRKRLALEGVLVPLTARGNEELLAAAGFTKVDCIWRWLNFAGWVAVR